MAPPGVQGEPEVELVSKILGKEKASRKADYNLSSRGKGSYEEKLPTATQYAFVTNLRERSVD